MPSYEYKCLKCLYEFEKLENYLKPTQKCPKCKARIRRKISAGSFIFKGSGFYSTDYGKRSKSANKKK